MQHTKANILSTRLLDQPLIDKAAESGIMIEALSFIETVPVPGERVIAQIRELSRTQSSVVFTSKHAAEAVVAQLQGPPPAWKIFCIGSATQEVLGKYFPPGSIAGTANSAALLAGEVIKQHPPAVVFFCGDQRRPELPEKLAANNIGLQELVVYKTVLTPKITIREYDGILFFSPSAAESFFSRNTLSTHTILFAIGDTTADYLRLRCSNRVVTSVTPSAEALAGELIHYFTTSNHINVSTKE